MMLIQREIYFFELKTLFQIYDTASQEWKTGPELSVPRAHATSIGKRNLTCFQIVYTIQYLVQIIHVQLYTLYIVNCIHLYTLCTLFIIQCILYNSYHDIWTYHASDNYSRGRIIDSGKYQDNTSREYIM